MRSQLIDVSPPLAKASIYSVAAPLTPTAVYLWGRQCPERYEAPY